MVLLRVSRQSDIRAVLPARHRGGRLPTGVTGQGGPAQHAWKSTDSTPTCRILGRQDGTGGGGSKTKM